MYSKLGTPGVIASHALCDDDYDIGYLGTPFHWMALRSPAILYVEFVFGESGLCSSITIINGEYRVYSKIA